MYIAAYACRWGSPAANMASSLRASVKLSCSCGHKLTKKFKIREYHCQLYIYIGLHGITLLCSYLTLTHTYTHTHKHTHTLTLTHTYTHTQTHTLSHTHALYLSTIVHVISHMAHKPHPPPLLPRSALTGSV